MNGYATPIVDATVPKLLRSHDIDKLFEREPGWFNRDRVRKRLYAKGFPHPVEAGRWSPLAIEAWMRGAGANPGNVPPDVERRGPIKGPRRRRRRAAASGYAEPGGGT
jgi:hypothetical protein